MLHRSFYIQGNSVTIRFPILPHFVSGNPLQFVFRIIHVAQTFLPLVHNFYPYAEQQPHIGHFTKLYRDQYKAI